jgi:hypothetical protein
MDGMESIRIKKRENYSRGCFLKEKLPSGKIDTG